MRAKTLSAFMSLLVWTAGVIYGAPASTAFTYHGYLDTGGRAAEGSFDFRFVIFDSPDGGISVKGALTNGAVDVNNGLFTTRLDFGPAVFAGDALWLEIQVRTNGGGAFTLLSPRQEMLPVPYAQYALTAATATTVAVGGIVSNSVQANAITTDKVADSSLLPADLDLPAFDTTFWKLHGNSGTDACIQFLGTTDNQPLEFKVNSQRALRLQAAGPNAACLIGGSSENSVESAVVGSIIAGGRFNTNRTGADWSSIAGGYMNLFEADSAYGAIAGGYHNTVGTNSTSATIGGGQSNAIEDNSDSATIGGGFANNIQADTVCATVAGGYWNIVQPGASHAIIGGGCRNRIGTSATNATISGGLTNKILTDAASATIGGGFANLIETEASHSVVAGGRLNFIGPNAQDATLGGGKANRIEANASRTIIAGGNANVIRSNAVNCTISGGIANTIESGSLSSFIGGGGRNLIYTGIWTATIAGGYQNTNTGSYATVPGGLDNVATDYSFAAGRRAKAVHQGSFVWGDATDVDLAADMENSVTFRASGGYRLFSDGAATVGASLAPGGNSWSILSDRQLKENVRPIDLASILDKVAALPVCEWNLTSQDPSVRHVGPMAQDFKAAFGLGEDDRHISSSDADGVALAAIKGLNQKLEEKNAELEQRVAELEALVDTLAAKVNGVAR